MENASKALIIAGSMLLIILVLTFAIYLFGKMASQTEEFYSDMTENEIDEFNQQFFNFDKRGTQKDAEGNWINPLTIQDVVTIINLAKDSNTKELIPIKINVKFCNEENAQNKSREQITQLLNNNMDNIYSCSVSYANKSKYVGSVTILKLD